MGVLYLDDFVRELASRGEVSFRRRNLAPVLVVTGQVARGERAGPDDATRLVAAETPRRGAALALLHRVFPLVKVPRAPAGPVSLGRTVENDVAIPEHSISKRHCTFEIQADGGALAIRDCGSTNGTLLNGARLDPEALVPLCGGEIVTIGRFTFIYETAAGFLELVAGMAQ